MLVLTPAHFSAELPSAVRDRLSLAVTLPQPSTLHLQAWGLQGTASPQGPVAPSKTQQKIKDSCFATTPVLAHLSHICLPHWLEEDRHPFWSLYPHHVAECVMHGRCSMNASI